MSRTNGHQEMQQEQFEQNLHGELQQSMRGEEPFGEDGTVRDEYLDRLVEHGLEEDSAALLENMLTRDFVLSKITNAEKTEMKWLVRLEKQKIIGMHPPRGSTVQGERRKFLYDANEALTPLSDREIQLLDMAVWDIFFRVARSVGGWQQQELSSQYRVSRVDRDNNEDSGRLGGLFS